MFCTSSIIILPRGVMPLQVFGTEDWRIHLIDFPSLGVS